MVASEAPASVTMAIEDVTKRAGYLVRYRPAEAPPRSCVRPADRAIQRIAGNLVCRLLLEKKNTTRARQRRLAICHQSTATPAPVPCVRWHGVSAGSCV